MAPRFIHHRPVCVLLESRTVRRSKPSCFLQMKSSSVQSGVLPTMGGESFVCIVCDIAFEMEFINSVQFSAVQFYLKIACDCQSCWTMFAVLMFPKVDVDLFGLWRRQGR